jgi:hypothetical protein
MGSGKLKKRPRPSKRALEPNREEEVIRTKMMATL